MSLKQWSETIDFITAKVMNRRVVRVYVVLRHHHHDDDDDDGDDQAYVIEES